MLLTGFISTVIAAIAKSFSGDFHPFQLMFFYCFGGLLCLLPFVIARAARQPTSLPAARTIRWRYHLIRSVGEFTAFSLTFYSLLKLPLPMQTAIGYTTPIFASLFAVLLVKETLNPRIWLSLMLGSIGLVIMYNPFASQALSSDQGLGVAAALCAAMVFGICASCIKLSTRTTPPLFIAFFMLLFTTLLAAPFALSVWQMPAAHHLPRLVAMGICVAAVQYCVSRAFSLGMVTRLVPLTYLNLVWASIFAYAFFGEIIGMDTIAGSIFIFGAVLLVSIRRRKTAII